MLSYCLNLRKNGESKNLKVVNKKNARIMVLSNRAVCGWKKPKLIIK